MCLKIAQKLPFIFPNVTIYIEITMKYSGFFISLRL